MPGRLPDAACAAMLPRQPACCCLRALESVLLIPPTRPALPSLPAETMCWLNPPTAKVQPSWATLELPSWLAPMGWPLRSHLDASGPTVPQR